MARAMARAEERAGNDKPEVGAPASMPDQAPAFDAPTAERATASAKHPSKVLTNSTFEDQENISLSIVRRRRKLS